MTYHDYIRWKTTPIEGEPCLSIVIPTYNEEDRILPTLGAIAAYVAKPGLSCEIIIADDGSSDQTAAFVEDLGFANVRVLRASANEGKGSAVRRGMLAARGRYILFGDADNSTPIEECSKLLKKLTDEHYDIAVGSRASEQARPAHRTLARLVLSGGLRVIVRTFFKIGIYDTQCGFKIFTRAAAHRLCSAQTINGFSFDLEILYLAAKQGLRIAEVPVDCIEAPGSKVVVSKEIQRFLRDLLRIKWNDMRGVYACSLSGWQAEH